MNDAKKKGRDFSVHPDLIMAAAKEVVKLSVRWDVDQCKTTDNPKDFDALNVISDAWEALEEMKEEAKHIEEINKEFYEEAIEAIRGMRSNRQPITLKGLLKALGNPVYRCGGGLVIRWAIEDEDVDIDDDEMVAWLLEEI